MKAAVAVPASDRHLRRGVPQGRRLHVAAADVAHARHRAVVRSHVQLDVRGGEGRGSRACERVDLVVVVAAQNPIGFSRQLRIDGAARQQASPGTARQPLERLAEPELVEHLAPGSEVRDAVDFRGVTDEAIDGPPERRARADVGRHAERRDT